MNKNDVEQKLEDSFGSPKCPECKSDARRPKCFFEYGSSCPRHNILDSWYSLNNTARNYVLKTEEE